MDTRCLGVWLGHPAPGDLVMGVRELLHVLPDVLTGLDDSVPCPSSKSPSVFDFPDHRCRRGMLHGGPD